MGANLRYHVGAEGAEVDGLPSLGRLQAVSRGFKFGQGREPVHDYYRLVSEAFAATDRGEDLSTHSSYFETEQTFESLLPAGVLVR